MKATYEAIQTLKHRLASEVSAFRAMYNGTDITVAFKCELVTNHGVETISVKISDIPSMDQGALPGMNDEAVEDAFPVPHLPAGHDSRLR